MKFPSLGKLVFNWLDLFLFSLKALFILSINLTPSEWRNQLKTKESSNLDLSEYEGTYIPGDSNNKTMTTILFDFISKYISLTEEEKNIIRSLDIFRSVKKGTILLKEGQKSKDSYFVLKGCIRTYYIIDSEEKTTAFYTEMEALTPPCVISKTPSEYYISCIEDTILTVSNSDMEAEINSKFPRFDTLCKMLSEELLAKQRIDFDEFKTSSPEQRYLNLIQKRPDLIQRVPQYQLASYLGIKPESLSRLRARIAEKK